MAKFPLDEDRCRQWVKAVGNKDLIYVPIERLHVLKYVCGNHFQSKAFNKKKTRLKKSATPTQNLKPALPDEMLLEFPCHIHSTNRVSQETSDTQTSQFQINAIAGTSTSGALMLGQQVTTQEPSDQLNTQRICQEVTQSPMEAITGPCTSGLHMLGQQMTVQESSDQLNAQGIYQEVTQSQMEAISGGTSRSHMLGQQMTSQESSDQLKGICQEVTQMEAIAGPSSSGLFMPKKPMALGLSDQRLLQSRKRKRTPSSGPSVRRHMHLQDHNYCSKEEKVNQSQKRKKLTAPEDIWTYVKDKGFKYLNLRQLNQDSLENFFGMIRQHCPTNRNPTCHHFKAAMKSNILTTLSTPISRGSNCEKDQNEAMVNFDDFISQIEQVKIKSSENPEAVIPVLSECADDIEDHEFSDDGERFLKIEKKLFENFECQPTVYVAGYLAAVILKKMSWECSYCKLSLIVEDPQSCHSKMYCYIRLREWWHDKRSLKYPSLGLCQLIDQMTACFESHVKTILYHKRISHQAVTMMLTKCDDLMWICNDHRERLLHILLLRLSYLLIRNECQQQNLCFSKAEEATSDKIKKAQLQGFGK